jgi:hypothetical protein
MECLGVFASRDYSVIRSRPNQQSKRDQQQRKPSTLQVLGVERQLLEAGLKRRAVLEPEENLSSQNQQARFIKRVLYFVF